MEFKLHLSFSLQNVTSVFYLVASFVKGTLFTYLVYTHVQGEHVLKVKMQTNNPSMLFKRPFEPFSCVLSKVELQLPSLVATGSKRELLQVGSKPC